MPPKVRPIISGMTTRRNRKTEPALRPWDYALTRPLPSGKAPNFNRLEAMRTAILDFLEGITTGPYLDNPGWAENEIQRAADRLKQIRLRRAEAIEDARAKGWLFIYGEQASDMIARRHV